MDGTHYIWSTSHQNIIEVPNGCVRAHTTLWAMVFIPRSSKITEVFHYVQSDFKGYIPLSIFPLQGYTSEIPTLISLINSNDSNIINSLKTKDNIEYFKNEQQQKIKVLNVNQNET